MGTTMTHIPWTVNMILELNPRRWRIAADGGFPVRGDGGPYDLTTGTAYFFWLQFGPITLSAWWQRRKRSA